MNAPAILAAHAALVPAVAVTLWLSLLAAAGAVFLAAGALAWWQRGRTPADPMLPVTPLRTRRPATADLARLLAEVDALSTQAVSAGIASADAEAAVTTAWARCRAAELARERAWREYDTAYRAFVSVLRDPTSGGATQVSDVEGGSVAVATAVAVAGANADPRVPRPRTGTDRCAGALNGNGTRGDVTPGDVTRAAVAAYRRGGLSVDQFHRILGHSTGWNHTDARHEREVLLRRAAERDARRRYHTAAAAERSAYRAVDVATVAARAWADEAAEAAEEARLARAFATECVRRAGTRGILGRLRRAGTSEEPAPALS